MSPEEIALLSPLPGTLNDECHRWLQSVRMAPLKAAIADAAEKLPPHLSLGVSVELRVYDSERGKDLRLLTTGMECSAHSVVPRPVWGDSSLERYIGGDVVYEVPNDYCPVCWGEWFFKFDQPACRACGVRLGRDVKVLLDRGICPHCERGAVSAASPTCDECGFLVPQRDVAWELPGQPAAANGAPEAAHNFSADKGPF